MKHFITLRDLPDFKEAVTLAKSLKKDPSETQGKRKTIGLYFYPMHPLSTQKAAHNLVVIPCHELL